jgi:hypothetical protein
MMDNREQLECLISEYADARLSDADRASIERLLAESATARDEARRYARLAALLSGWRAVDAKLDWRSLAVRFQGTIREEVESRTLLAVDDLLESELAAMPPVDWAALQGRISSAVRREPAYGSKSAGASKRTLRLRRYVFASAPLAAAAMIAFTVFSNHSEPLRIVPKGSTIVANAPRVDVTLGSPSTGGKVSVEFVEGSIASQPAPAEPGRSGFAATPGGKELPIREAASEETAAALY